MPKPSYPFVWPCLRRLLVFAVCWLLTGLPDAGAVPPAGRVRQITGQTADAPRVADPALQLQPDGSVWVSGTGALLSWPSLDALMVGQPPQARPLRLFERVRGQVVPLNDEELPWDLEFYQRGGRQLLIGGLMSPRPDAWHARWPADNISRRIKQATYDSRLSGWVFDETPLFGQVDFARFPGHSYGHQLFSEAGQDYLFHDQVSSEVDTLTGLPCPGSGHFATEIFLRRLSAAGEVSAPVRLLGIQDLPLEATRRVLGGFLLEGPRPARYVVQGRCVHVIFFSTGDYPTKNYTVRAAYSTQGLLGPYRPIGEPGQPANLTADLQQRLGLYGVGRAFPFSYRGQSWILFHGAHDLPGVDHTRWPKQEPLRQLFVAPLEMGFDAAGRFWLRIPPAAYGG